MFRLFDVCSHTLSCGRRDWDEPPFTPGVPSYSTVTQPSVKVMGMEREMPQHVIAGPCGTEAAVFLNARQMKRPSPDRRTEADEHSDRNQTQASSRLLQRSITRSRLLMRLPERRDTPLRLVWNICQRVWRISEVGVGAEQQISHRLEGKKKMSAAALHGYQRKALEKINQSLEF